MLIDVSHYQTINWAQAHNGADGFYIKLTEGASSVDARWTANYAGAAGKPRGAYHFADGANAVAEANHFADQYLTRSWELRPVLDAETANISAAWIKAFRAQFRARTGHQSFRVYSSYALLIAQLNPAGWIDANTDIWAARYNSTLGWTHPQLVLWQNSSSAHVAGILGNVDVDQYMNGWTPARDSGDADMAITSDDIDLIFNRTQFTRQGAGQTGNVSLGLILAWFDNNMDSLIAAVNASQTAVVAAIQAVSQGQPPTDAQMATLATTIAAALPQGYDVSITPRAAA